MAAKNSTFPSKEISASQVVNQENLSPSSAKAKKKETLTLKQNLMEESGVDAKLSSQLFSNVFRFYEILSDAESNFQKTTLSALTDLFGLRYVTYAIFDKSRSGNRYVSDIWGTIPEEQMKAYKDHFYRLDPFYLHYPALIALAPSHEVYTSSLFGDKEFQSSAWGQFLKKNNIGYHALLGGGYIDITESDYKWPRHILCVYKTIEEGPFTAEELALYRLIGRAFCHCVSNYKKRTLQRRISMATDLFLDGQDRGFAILDGDGSVLRYNWKFMDLGFSLTRQSQNLSADKIAENLIRLMNFQEVPPSGSQEIHWKEENGILVIGQRSFFNIDRSISLFTFLFLEKKQRAYEEDHLATALIAKYGLTLREAQIGNLAFQRLTNAEIQEKLYITASTLKSHMRNIYAKCSVSSRSEFIRICSTL